MTHQEIAQLREQLKTSITPKLIRGAKKYPITGVDEFSMMTIQLDTDRPWTFNLTAVDNLTVLLD